MKLTVYENTQAMAVAAAERAAEILRGALREQGRAAFVAATGASQFEFLDRLVKVPDIAWERTTRFHLAECIGMPQEHPASFRRYLQERLVSRVPVGTVPILRTSQSRSSWPTEQQGRTERHNERMLRHEATASVHRPRPRCQPVRWEGPLTCQAGMWSRARDAAWGILVERGAGKRLAAPWAIMAARFYRIILVPDADTPPETLHVPAAAVRVASTLLALALLTFGFIVYHYVTLHAIVLQMQRAQDEPAAVSLGRVRQIAEHLTRLDDLDRRLRVAAGLAPFHETRIGRGGSWPEADATAPGEERAVRLVERLPADLRAIEQEISSRAQGLLELTQFVEEKRDLLASTPTIWPVEGLLTDAFGHRRSPFSGQGEMHEGLDIAAPVGTAVRAAADGVVSFVGPLASFGTVVFLRHGHGFATLYAHLGRTAVRPAQALRRGTALGSVGLTGRTTGAHLHYEVHLRGTPVNPLLYIVDAAEARRAVAAVLPGERGGAGPAAPGRARMTGPPASRADASGVREG